MRDIYLGEPCLSDEETAKLHDLIIGREYYNKPVLGGEYGENTLVRKDDGCVLCLYLRCPHGMREALRQGLKAFRSAVKWSEKRQADSGSVGFLAPSGVYPFGRTSGFTKNNPEEWKTMLPTFELLHDLFAANLPDEYALQKEVALKTSRDFLIPKTNGGLTCMTTGTVNNTHQFRCHVDDKNLAGGMSIMTVWRKENPFDYKGGFVVFPQWKVAVNTQCGDVLIFDGYDLHGNSPFYGDGERISIVGYYQARMLECGSFEDEEEKAKRLVR